MVQAAVLQRDLDGEGAATGVFNPSFVVWARWTQNPGVMAGINGQREDKIDLVVTVNDTDKTRTITNSDRMHLRGEDYTIASVGLPERKSGTIQLLLSRGSNA